MSAYDTLVFNSWEEVGVLKANDLQMLKLLEYTQFGQINKSTYLNAEYFEYLNLLMMCLWPKQKKIFYPLKYTEEETIFIHKQQIENLQSKVFVTEGTGFCLCSLTVII